MRASRSTTWEVTSEVPVCSERTFWPSARMALRASSQRATGRRKVIVAEASSPLPQRLEPAT